MTFIIKNSFYNSFSFPFFLSVKTVLKAPVTPSFIPVNCKISRE